MDLSLEKNSSSPFENWIDSTLFISYKAVLKWNDRVFGFFKGMLGIIGLVIAIPVLFLLAIIGWFFLLSLNYRMERDLVDYNTMINLWDDRRKMEEHLIFEKAVEKFKFLMQKAISRKFIINPITKQTIILLKNMENMEHSLKKTAYPTIDTPLSKTDEDYLLSIFDNSECKDWKENSSLSYEL